MVSIWVLSKIIIRNAGFQQKSQIKISEATHRGRLIPFAIFLYKSAREIVPPTYLQYKTDSQIAVSMCDSQSHVEHQYSVNQWEKISLMNLLSIDVWFHLAAK